MAFISIESLTTRYNTSKGLVHALEDVSFTIEKGESIGIAGESACVKSTLGLSIIRMIPNWSQTQPDEPSPFAANDSDLVLVRKRGG